MAYKYKTISGDEEDVIFYSNRTFADRRFFTSIVLCNTHLTDSVSVDLYVVTSDLPQKDEDYYLESDEDLELYGNPPDDSGDVTERVITETNYYILKGVSIPVNTSLLLKEEDLRFNPTNYELRIKLSAEDSAVDLTINFTE